MRLKRVEIYRKNRYRNMRKFFFLAIILPCTCILLGYIITSLVILPAMVK